jgi:threonine synthase
MTAPPTPARDIWQQCCSCHHRIDERDAHTSCPQCGGLLDVLREGPAETSAVLRRRFDDRRGAFQGPDASGVWRYRELIVPATDAEIVTYPEGNTPLLERHRVADWAECAVLLLKHEGMNPTGSFKDRGMTVGITQALRLGAKAVACASTGNTSASLAAYAALAGLPALVLVPRGKVALGKLAQTLAYGARTLLVRGDFDACLTIARRAAEELGVYLLNSINPFRIEGQKTIVFELLHQLSWHVPDWIALPAGNLGNTAAFGKALREALACGLIDRMPRLLAVQAAGAAPFHASYVDGFRQRARVTPDTVATAIRIGDPASFDRAVDAIRATDGAVVAVSDEAILDAKALIDAAGVGCEPASAASVAGVREAVRTGVIPRDSTVVAVLTGHVLKDPAVTTWYHQEADPSPRFRNAPVEVEPSVEAVEHVLAAALRQPRGETGRPLSCG